MLLFKGFVHSGDKKMDWNRLKIKIKNKYKKEKRKLKTKKTRFFKYCGKKWQKTVEKAKQLYMKINYINYIGKKLFRRLSAVADYYTEYKENINNAVKFYFQLLLYITMYGIPFCLGVSILTNHFSSNPIPFNIAWIYVIGLIIYSIKEELTRVVRNLFPARNGALD